MRKGTRSPVPYVGLAFLAGMAACGAPSGADPGPADVSVELDAYSGLPNPLWTLSPAEAGELAARLRGLPEAAGAEPPEATLGYRGFRVRNEHSEGGIPEMLYVSRGGIIQIFVDEERSRLVQDVAGVEALLIESARRKGHGGLFP